MLKTREVQFEEVTITLRALPAAEASDLAARLARMVGPAFAALTGALEGAEDVGAVLKGVPEAARLFFGALTPEEFRIVREKLLTEAVFATQDATGPLMGKLSGGGKLTNFDVVFSGRVGQVFPVLWAAIELNFGFSVAAMLDAVKSRAANLFASRAKSSNSGPVTAS